MLREKDTVLKTKQAARFLQCSRQKLIVLVNKGILPAAKFGREYRFSKLQLLKYITTGEPQGKAKPQDQGKGGPQ